MAQKKSICELEKDVTVFKSKYKMANGIIREQQEKRKIAIKKAFELKSKEMLETLLEGSTVAVPYIAKESSYKNKKGHVSKCYVSVYGKYAGTVPIVLDYYMPYDKSKFVLDFVKNKVLYKQKTFTIGDNTVVYQVAEYYVA